MTQAANKMRSPLKIVAIILTVITVIVFLAALAQINESSQGYSYNYDSRDYIYSVERNRFGEVYDTAIRDMSKQAEHSAEIEEYRTLGLYYEQAVLEHAYRTIGDDEKADAFAERMKEYESELGSLSSKAEAVRKYVGEKS